MTMIKTSNNDDQQEADYYDRIVRLLSVLDYEEIDIELARVIKIRGFRVFPLLSPSFYSKILLGGGVVGPTPSSSS